MRFLLDTHVLVWWLNDDKRLSAAARGEIASAANDCFVSAATAWEVATKVRRKRWPQADALAADFRSIVARNGFQLFSITPDHALLAGRLDVAHAGPFDRMLASQTLLEDLTLITVDSAFELFDVRTMW